MTDEGRPNERTISHRVLREMRDLSVGNRNIILDDLKKHVLRQAVIPDEERDQTMLHPSDMCKSDWCYRADYYRMTGTRVDDTKGVSPSFRLENVWAEGHTIHRKWQTWLWEMGALYGVFECRQCEERWWDRAPKDCYYCGAAREFLRYKEVPLTAPHLHIGGHADGGLWWDDSEPFRLLEVKSININSLRFDAPELYERYLNNDSLDKIWMEINRPFPVHVRQGALYLYMATRGVPEVPIPKEMVFLYEWKPNQDVKEFTVVYNARLVERALAGAQLVTDALDIGRPPPRPRWAADEQVATCRSCAYRMTCWKIREHDKQHEDAPTPVVKAPVAVRRRAFTRKAG